MSKSKPFATPATSHGRKTNTSSDLALGTVSRRLQSVLETDVEDSTAPGKPKEKSDHDFFSGLTGLWPPSHIGLDGAPKEKQSQFPPRRQTRAGGSKAPEKSEALLAFEEELKEQFLKSGTELAQEVTRNLSRAEKAVNAQIAGTEARDAAVTDKLSTITKDYSLPFSESMSSFQLTENGTSQTQSVHVGEAVGKLRRQLASAEKEMGQLWGEWDKAQEDVDAAMLALSGNGEDEGGSFEVLQAEVEKQLDAAATESRREIKACETEFGSLIQLEQEKLIQAMLSAPSPYD